MREKYIFEIYFFLIGPLRWVSSGITQFYKHLRMFLDILKLRIENNKTKFWKNCLNNVSQTCEEMAWCVQQIALQKKSLL